jgi:hypothetical protein
MTARPSGARPFFFWSTTLTTLIATDRFPYNNEALVPGDQFEAEAGHADLLIAANKARRPKPMQPEPAAQSVPAQGEVLNTTVTTPGADVDTARIDAEPNRTTATRRSGSASGTRQTTRRTPA